MKAAAVICECNPFHHGHAYIFKAAREHADCVIAVMSGNFVQRAETSVFDKYARAEAIVRSDADLVVELPFPWCSASAEFFANAGVSLAKNLLADTLVFGATQNDPDMYQRAADILETPEAESEIVRLGAPNRGVAQARELYLRNTLGDEFGSLLQLPNDILAIEYYRAASRLHAKIQLTPKCRISAEDDPAFLGATALREKLFGDNQLSTLRAHIPMSAYSVFECAWSSGYYASPDALARIVFQSLRLDHSGFTETAEGGCGVLDRLKRCADTACSAEEMFQLAATKKYTNARFRRAALFHLMHVEMRQLRENPRFTHVLAANPIGCRWLSLIRSRTEISILTKPSAADALSAETSAQYALQCAADRLYTLCQHSIQPAGAYLRRTPYIERNS